MLLERRQSENEAAVEDGTIRQAAAICLSVQSKATPAIILVRSSRTGLWGLPKGGIEFGEVSARAAEREAFEEAGVTGTICPRPTAYFSYSKDGVRNRFDVAVHVLLDFQLADHYPECDSRERGCFPLAAAVDLVAHPQVRRILVELLDLYQPQ